MTAEETAPSSRTHVRAVGIRQPGGVEVVDVVERSVREPGAGEVRIAVKAAAVNPTDSLMRQRGVPDAEPPWTPGWEAAGFVESVGEGVTRLAVGDAVMAAVWPWGPDGGAQAELVVVSADCAVAIPAGATLAQAATLPMNGLTATLGLDMLGLLHGQTLAVTGGAGLLASYVIALAKCHGLQVIADANAADEELVRSFGADAIVPRGDDFVAAVRAIAPEGVEALYDTALCAAAVLGAVRSGGGCAVVRGWDGSVPERGIQIKEVWVPTAAARTDWLEDLRQLASEGRIQLRVAAEYPPERASEAQRIMDAGGLRGRLVIVF